MRWLQGIAAYADLRQPTPLPAFAHARCLDDLSLRDCEWLATQEGFAGRLSFDGRHFEWARRIDFQPAAAIADAGSLEWNAGVLIERGRDVEYVEHWHRDAVAVAPVGAALLCELERGTNAVLVRVGDEFMFGRDRSVPLPAHPRLQQCIAAATSLQMARRLIDCEISVGSVEADGFRITASTLPFRCGTLLGQRLFDDSLSTEDRHPDGTAVTRRWHIVEVEGDSSVLQSNSIQHMAS